MYERFEELLKERGVTSSFVAKEIGIGRSTLTDWKKGRTTPKLDKLSAIADYFDVRLEWLTGESNVKTKNERIAQYDEEHPLSDEAQKLMSIITELSDEDLMKLRLYIDFMKQAKEIDEKPKND
jgi:repressor LexA